MAQYIRPVYVPSPPFSVPKSVRRAFKLFRNRNLAKVPVADVLQRNLFKVRDAAPHTHSLLHLRIVPKIYQITCFTICVKIDR